jgi:RNA polymerase sigma factor (sigma-70 family)
LAERSVRQNRFISSCVAFERYTLATAVPLSPSLPAPLLRLRSDEQLLGQFRAGREDAFRILHERYHDRLLAYVRHMLHGHADAEDVVQDVFERAYSGLRAGERDIAVRPWLYRVAHNRCIDYARRAPTPPLPADEGVPGGVDPVIAAERREDLRRLVADLLALPEQQRSALIIRELEGLSYADLATALGVTVPAVKSLLVRARTGLADAAEARDTACAAIREQLALAVDRRGRPPRLLRNHLRTCAPCRAHRRALRHGHAELGSLLPGPSSLLVGGWLASLAGGGGGGSTGAATGSALAAGTTKALAVASASVAVAGGAAEVAETVRSPARPARADAAAIRPSHPTINAAARPQARARALPAAPVATTAPSARAAVPLAVSAPPSDPLPVDSEPAEAGPAADPAATPEATETPEPTATPEATPEAAPTPDAAAKRASAPATTPAPTP